MEIETMELEEAEASPSPEEMKGMPEAAPEVKNAPVPAQDAPSRVPLMLDADMAFKPTSFDEFYRMCNMFAKSGFMPKRFKDAAEIMTAIQFAVELGLKPITGLRQIAVIEGTPSIFGTLPLSLCYKSGLMEEFEETYFLKDGTPCDETDPNLFGAQTMVKRKGRKPIIKKFTLDMAKRANLIRNKAMPWDNYPHLMLKYRARSTALKDALPDVLDGIAIAEYDFDRLPTHEGSRALGDDRQKERVTVDISKLLENQGSTSRA